MKALLRDDATHVVTELELHDLSAKGHHVEVVCRVAAYRRSSVWYGEWIVRVVGPNRSSERTLVTAPRCASGSDRRRRLFKTISGLCSFMRGVGFDHIDIPLLRGGRSIHTLTSTAPEASPRG